MSDSKYKLNNAKDKVLGEVKKADGKITGNEEMELKGKIQSSKSDLKERGIKTKKDIVESINDIIDEKTDKK
ncbi:MAG: CsbD family protein [Peptostreptococcaceae bacterium]|nr:CsbD family protein [Peptostreptococcaceae bacterium]